MFKTVHKNPIVSRDIDSLQAFFSFVTIQESGFELS